MYIFKESISNFPIISFDSYLLMLLKVYYNCVDTQTNDKSLVHHHNLSIFFTNLEPCIHEALGLDSCHETLNAHIAH
jgi:hypothetical protein